MQLSPKLIILQHDFDFMAHRFNGVVGVDRNQLSSLEFILAQHLFGLRVEKVDSLFNCLRVVIRSVARFSPL